MYKTMVRMVAALAIGLLAFTGSAMISAPQAAAYDWSELKEGDSGKQVKELQIRIAGWVEMHAAEKNLKTDGEFGADTTTALKNFQKAYGIDTSGVVDAATQDKLNALEDSDGTANFDYSEFKSKDGAGFTGGKVDEATVKENVRRMMYKLEAMRKKAGDEPIKVNSAFRSESHNENVGGATNSQHMYGIAADIVISNNSVDDVIGLAKTSGYSGIIRYDNFTHVDNRMEHDYGQNDDWHWDV